MSITFNPNKSFVVPFLPPKYGFLKGGRFAVIINGATLPVRQECRYIGYKLSNNGGFDISFLSNCRNFYASINSIFKSGKGRPNPLVGINICKSRSLPLLTYGTEFACYSRRGTENLNVAWNNGLRCIAGLRYRSSVATTNLSLNVLPLGFQSKLRAILFYKRMIVCKNSDIRRLANREFCCYKRTLAPTLIGCHLNFPIVRLLSKFATKNHVASSFCQSCEPYILENASLVRNLYSLRRSFFVTALINHLVRPSYEL